MKLYVSLCLIILSSVIRAGYTLPEEISPSENTLTVCPRAELAPVENDSCMGRLVVNIPDRNAVIMINDTAAGTGHLDTMLNAGTYILQVKFSGQQWGDAWFADTLSFSDCGEQKRYDLSQESYHIPKGDMKPDMTRNYAMKQPGSKQNLSGLDNGNMKQFLKSNKFKLLAGSAILLGAVSAYFKLKANKEYDRYTETRLQDHLDNTDRYDTISGVAFGALQLNFAALIYFFLED